MTMTEEEVITHPVPSRLLDSSKYPVPHINSLDKYKSMWKESVEDPEKFFGNVSHLDKKSSFS